MEKLHLHPAETFEIVQIRTYSSQDQVTKNTLYYDQFLSSISYMDLPRHSLCASSVQSFSQSEALQLLNCLVDMKQGIIPESHEHMITRVLRLGDLREEGGVDVVHFFLQTVLDDVASV